MMIKRIFLLVLATIISGCTTIPTMEDFQQMKEDALDPTPSYVNRQNTNLQLGLRGPGEGFHQLQSSTFLISKSLTPDQLIDFEGFSEDGRAGSWSKRPYYGNTFVFGLGFRQFFGNSIYLRGAARYREFNLNKSRDLEFGYYFKGHRGEAIAGIGSQWQWKSIAWGIELNSVVPVLANFSEEGLDNAIAKDRFVEEKARFSSHPQHFIQIYLGFTLDPPRAIRKPPEEKK